MLNYVHHNFFVFLSMSMSTNHFNNRKILIWNCCAETYYILGTVHSQTFPFVLLYLESWEFGLPLEVIIWSYRAVMIRKKEFHN